LPELALDLVRLNVSVIFAATPTAVAAARKATTTIPIVTNDLESDPITMGYVKSLARPGGNITGVFLDIPELSGKQVALLKQIVPGLSRIAIFGVPGLNEPQFAATETAARALGLEAEIMEVLLADDFENALEVATTKHVAGGVLLSSPLVFSFVKQIARASDSQRATTHLLVRRISKGGRSHCLRAERNQDFQKMRGFRREDT